MQGPSEIQKHLDDSGLTLNFVITLIINNNSLTAQRKEANKHARETS